MKFSKVCNTLISLSSCFLSLSATAGTIGSIDNGPWWHQYAPYVITVSAGPAWYNAGETQTFYVVPGVEKTYAAVKPNHSLAVGELFLSVERPLANQLRVQGGINVIGTGDANLEGFIWEYADPMFDNYAYNYKVAHTSVGLKGKLITSHFQWVEPYLSASVGVAFNQSSKFDRRALIEGEIPHPPYQSYTQTAFSYTAGAGLQHAINEHWFVGVGYDFSDWGKSRLNRFEGQTLNTGLKLNHLYTNELQFSLGFVG